MRTHGRHRLAPKLRLLLLATLLVAPLSDRGEDPAHDPMTRSTTEAMENPHDA
jgi:hypothetical protein